MHLTPLLAFSLPWTHVLFSNFCLVIIAVIDFVILARSLVLDHILDCTMESEKVVPVHVAVRSRPLVSKELIEGCQVCARTFPSNQSIVLGGDKIFTYDYVFGEESSQVQVYDTCVSKLLPEVFAGEWTIRHHTCGPLFDNTDAPVSLSIAATVMQTRAGHLFKICQIDLNALAK